MREKNYAASRAIDKTMPPGAERTQAVLLAIGMMIHGKWSDRNADMYWPKGKK